MNLLINAFNTILYRPLFNALILLYQYFPGHDFGVAVIVLTVLIRILLHPLMIQSVKSQKVLSDLQPKIQEIKNKYKEDKEKQAKETMALYQKEKINPLGGCLPLLIQLPILIAIYQVFGKGLRPEAMANLYSFIPHPGEIDLTFLGIMNLSQPNLILAIFASIALYFQTKMMTPKTQKAKDQAGQFSQLFQKQTLYFLPILTFFILLRLPAAISLYWLITSLFSIFQQYFILKPST